MIYHITSIAFRCGWLGERVEIFISIRSWERLLFFSSLFLSTSWCMFLILYSQSGGLTVQHHIYLLVPSDYFWGWNILKAPSQANHTEAHSRRCTPYAAWYSLIEVKAAFEHLNLERARDPLKGAKRSIFWRVAASGLHMLKSVEWYSVHIENFMVYQNRARYLPVKQ